MKKHLCFVLILCLALSGLYAQSPCVRFDMPNLYPVPGTPQDVDIYFNNAGLDDNTQYAITYTLLHNGEEIDDVDLATHINTASSYLLIPFYTNNSYSGQFLNSPSSIFPSGTFEAGLNMNNTQFNFFYGKYLKTNSVRIRMHLAWRSDRTYDDDEYTLIVNLVEMQNGTKVNKKYNGTVNIGGIGATPTGVTVTSDTIHTIKRVEDIIYDTICYSQLPYTMPGSRTTITTDTVVKANYIQPSGSAFYSIVNTTMTFGNPLNANQCNERIDSIATVRIYVRPELTLSNASTGHNLTICSYANAGYVSVIPTGGKAPYTVYAYKKSSADTYESVPTSSITITSSGTAGTINGLGVGTYKLVCVDAAGCQPAEETEAIISQVGTDNVYNIATISTTNVFCYGGSNGAIDIDVTHTSGDGAGELTYQWTGPNDFSATTQDINNVPAGTYNVTVSDTMGCKATQQYTLDDGTLITTSTNVACCASELPYHYDTNHADTIFYSAGTKEVHYTSFMGCDSVVNVTLTVRDNPTVNWGETPASVCVGATLTATANTGMSDYHWTKDGNATADDDNTADFTWTAAGTQSISVNFTQTITTDGLTTNCRVVSDTVKEITVNPLPTTTVTVAVNENPKDGTEITVCDGQTVTITATDGCEYAWKKVGNDATIGTEKTLTLANVTTANAGKYAVVLTNTTTGCTVHSDTVTLTVNAPAVTITTPMADATICEGTTTTTYNLSIEATAGTGSTLSYAWTNNKSATFSDATVANPTATLTDTTTFYVDVTATIGACSVHAYDTVVVNVNAPKVTLNAIATTNPNDTILCASSTGTTLTISTAESKGTVVYTWFNQSNNESVNITPSDIEDNYREFSVSAVATIGNCTKEDSKSIKVYVLRPNVTNLTITPSSATICKNSDITLTASATETEHVSYVWTNNVNTDTYTGATYTVSPTANTTFTVTCTDTVSKDAVVCTKQDTKTVEVTVLAPAVTINKVNDTTICYGQTVTLPTSAIVATSNGTLSYNWNDGTNNLAVYDVTPEATTTYYLTVTNTVSANSVDCPAYAYDTVVVNVNRPFVTLGKMDDATICYEESTDLAAIVTTKANDRLGYQWKSSKLDGSDMETLSSHTAGIHVTPTDTTVYYLTVIDTVGSCTAVAYDTVIVNVNHPQVTANNITVTPAANPICVGSSTKLTASVDGTYGIISYKWNDDVTVADTTVAPAATATFTVTVTATIGECSVSATKGFEVVVNDTVQLTATPTKQSVCPGSEVTFSHSVTSGTLSESTSELPTGLIYSNTAGTITGAPTTAGTYYITVTATSNQAANCPVKSVIDTLIVNSTVAFTASDTTQSVCPGTAITNVAFTVENGTLPATISGLPAGLTYNQADKRISGTPTQVGIFHYSVTATSDQTPACDSKTITGTITVYDTATLTVTGTTEQALCLGEKLSTIKFAKTNGVYNLETAGTLPAGVTFVGDSISGTPTESGTFTYTITVVSDHNCSNYNKQKTVTIQIKDTVELTLASSSAAKDQEFCLGSSLENITMDSANCTLAISWDNTPAGVTFAQGVISGTPTGTGNTYNYTVTATSNNGCTSTNKTISGTITVNDTVELAFHAGTTGDRTICLGDAIEDIVIDTANCNPVTITGLPAGLSYADGKIIGRPTASGDYTIAATNAKNCHNKTISGTITVNDTVVLKFHEGNGDRIVCQGAAIEDIVIDTANCNPVTITGLSAGLSYANGKITGTPTATGSYTIAASNGNNCRNKTISGTITVNDTVVPTISANNNTICVSASETHDTVTLSTNITEAGYTFAWTLDGGAAIASTSTTSDVVKAQWTTAGTKTIGVAITNSTTNCVSRANANIVVNDVTTFTVAHTASRQSGEYRICAYDKDTLTPSVESGINYTWTPNEHLTVYNSYKQIFAYDRAGKYTYTVSGLVAETGCQTSQTVSIIVDSVPTVTITPTDVTCFGANNGSLVANVTGGTASYCYRWSDNNVNVCGQPATHSRGNIQGETLQPTAYPATYSVTVMDIHGCTATASAEIKEPAALTVTKTQHVNVACFNGNNGILAYEATGGKPTASGNYNFKFNRNEAESATSKIYSGLSASIDTIKVTDANGCSVTLYDTIIQPEEFHVSISGITGNRDSICADGTANYKSVLTAAQDGYTYQYQWYKNDVILTDSTRDEITNLSNPAGEYEYKVVVTQQTTSAPCTQKDSVVLTVLAMPTTAITVLNDTICFGTSATLTANGAQAYQWKLDGTDKGTASTLAIEQASGSEEYFRHTYELTGTNTYGTKNCVVTDDTVIIINNPYVTLTPMEDKTICNETEQTLTATIATNANNRLGYDWKSSKLDGSNMVALTEHTASINVAPTDTTVYYLTVTDTVGNCTAVAYDTVVVKVNGPAVTLADITYAPNDTVCLGESVTLTASYETLKGEISYKWSANGTNRADTTVTPSIGSHEYTVTATATIGTCSVTATKMAKVVVNDTVKLAYVSGPKDTTICKGQLIPNIVYSVENGTMSILWPESGSQGLSFNAETGTISGTPTATVTYTIKATSNKNPQCSEKTITHTITVNDTLESSIVATDNICIDGSEANDTLKLYVANLGTTNRTYEWNLGANGNAIGTATDTVKAQWSSTGSKTVTVTVTDGNNCNSTFTKTITVNDTTTFAIAHTAINATICAGGKDTLTPSVNDLTYTWTPTTDLTSISGSNAQEFSSEVKGTHTYTVIGTNNNNCSLTKTTTVTVDTLPTVAITALAEICRSQSEVNDTLTLSVAADASYNYTWTLDGGIAIGETNAASVKAQWNTTGTKTITVTVTNGNSCKKSDSKTIAVNDTADFAITAKNGEICADTHDTLTVTDGYTYAWNAPAGLTMTNGANDYKKAFNGTPTTSTTYTVTVTAATDKGCKTTKTKEITVDSLPRPTITIPSDAKICLSASETNNTLLLTTQANYSNYAWNFGTDGATTDSDNDATMNAQWTTAGGKTVTVTVTNSKNCAGTGTTTITVKDTTTFAFASKDGDFEICMGMSDTVTATPADLTYTWPTATELGGTANNVRGFTSNTKGVYNYNVAGINADGCQLTKTVTLTVDTVPAVTLTPTDVLCYGGHTGKMEAAVTGGNTFTYAWTNSAHETVSDVTALPVGRYYVTVTNDYGCTATANDTIMQPDTLTIEVTALTNIACSYSGNMGSITVLAQGGKTTVEKPYTYKFNEEDYLNRIPTWTSLNNGNYTITVKDANNCTASVDTVIKRPEVLTITHDSINPSCFGSTNGKIIAHVTGGNEGTISYTWSNNGSVNDTLNGIGAGKYTLQVNDVKGCVAHDTIVLTQPEEFHVVLSGEDSICAGGTTTFTANLTPTASYTYKWYKDNTLMESETGTSITATEAGKYIVVASQGTTNCEQRDTVTLTMLSNPVLTITVTPNDTICLDGTATISVATADAYAWKQNGIDAGSDDLVNVPQTVGTYCYEVTGTNTYGTKTCSTTAKDTVVVLPLPSATLTVNNEPKAADCDVTVCALNSLVISVPDQTGVTYKWYKNDAQMDSTRHELNFAAITAENAGEYKVKVTNSTTQCDSTSYKVNVTVNPLPSATISVNGEVKTANSEVAVCNSGSLVISVPEQSGATYKWFKDNAQMDSTRHELNFATVAATDAATYYAKVTGANTCDSTSYTVKVTVDTLPAVTITALDSICLSASERFDTLTLSASTGASYTYEWALDGGEAIDGTTTSSATVKAQWSSVSGTKTVSVTITNGKGCKNTEEKEITAFDINDFTITADHERFCADAYDTLTVSDGNNYEWVCPTGLTMTDGDNDFKKSFKAANNSRTTDFTITVKGTTDKGCLITKTKEIKVDSLPNVTVNDPSVCRNSSVTLEAAGATTYAWAPADSLTASEGTSVNFKSAAAGTFEIVVTGTNGQGCSATDTATITVNDLPGSGALASLGTEKFCKGGVKGFKVSGYNDYVWTSTPADGSLTFLGDSATFTGNTPGSYVVLVEVTDANGCKSSTSANVTVDTLPVPTITANANVCVNGALEFTTENTDVNNYVWTFNGEKVDSTGARLKLKWNTAGEKTVTVNYTDNNGCTATTATSKSITVHALPVVEITEGRDSSICRGSSITLHATTGTPAATDFLWANGVGDDDEVTVTPVTNDSIFIVTGSYIPYNGLTCASTDTIIVHLKDTVKLTVENATQTKCLGQAIDNITVNYEAANLSWNPTSFTEGLTSTEVANTVTLSGNITHAGTYTYVVTATSTNNCGTKEATITLTVNDTNKLSSASTLTQTICLGTDIDGIVLDTANCTLSFSPELSTKGLSYNATTATISGTPSVAENFTVTITATPATDGCNAAKTLAFTITVLDTNKLEFVDPATATQEICLGEPIADIVLDTANCTLDLSQVTAINGLSYNAASHKIEGTPVTAGTYTATITATATKQVDAATPCNAVITRNITIKVNDTVKIAATEGDNLTRKLCKGNSINEVKLWATNGTIALGSGSIPTDLSTSYPTSANDTIKLNGTMATAGTYEFFVVATGTACTTSKDSLKVTITVDTIPFVAITPNVDTVCPNTDLRTATLTATAGYVTYAWSCSSENANIVTVTPEDNQNIYTVTVTNGQNCTATANDTIRLYTLSVSTISGDNKICLGESTTLTAAPDANHTAASYEWIGIAGANTNEITVKPVADSIFRVRVVDNNGCYDTAKITITVDTLPNASITASAITVCQDDTVKLTANNNGSNLTYLWKDGADSVFNARMFNFVTDTNTTANIHKISVQITDGEGCVNSDTASVTVKLVPILSETHNRVRCYGESTAAIDLNVRYKENIVVDETYAWTKEGDASFSRTTEDINGLAKGTYNVTVSDGNCSAEMSVTIEQPDTLTLSFAHTVSQLCSGTDSLTVVPVGGNGGFHYVWTTDGTDDAVTTDSILRISNLTAGTHTYTVTVTDDSNCVAYTPTAVEVTSERIEVQREITLGPGETYSYGGYTYGLSPEDEGKTFEVSSGAMGTGNCDSVFIYTIHMYGIGMNFTDGSYTIRHSGYFNNYLFTPSVSFDTIQTSVETANEFYAYVNCGSDSIDDKRIDMKYEILFNDAEIPTSDFTDYITDMRMMSYYDHDRNFYGIPHIDSARGEMPGTTFLYQYPSNSTAYYYDYFNFGAFRNMPQKIQFTLMKEGTYTFKFTVEERVESTGGQTWGFYNPYVVNGAYGPIWGGRGDTYTGKKTISSRVMTVIVGETGSTSSTPIITSIDNYANNTVPTVTTFPNPARDLLNLNISGMEGNTRITITDATGKLVRVYDEHLPGNDATLTYDIANFSQGIYFINVYNNETILTNKFIVTK